MQLGERLEMIRKANNKSQNDIAEVLNTTQQQYWKYEKNKQELPIRHLITLANYYNTTTDNILGITNVMQAIQNKEEQEVIKLYRDLTEREKGRILERMQILILSDDNIYAGLEITHKERG